MPLPRPGPGFTSKKRRILERLAVPEGEYTDLSPKGSVDEGIRGLIGEINSFDGLVTTSSCAGRVSVFVEGAKRGSEAEGGEREGRRGLGAGTRAAAGGKGGGGRWLFVSHDPLSGPGDGGGGDVVGLLGLAARGRVETEASLADDEAGSGKGRRLIHFKFEPLILHVLASSLRHAQIVLKGGLQAGFRESGAHGLVPAAGSAAAAATKATPPSHPCSRSWAAPPEQDQAITPMVAIRSMGLGFESLIGYQSTDGENHLVVSPEYLWSLVGIANERFKENTKRIARFREALEGGMEKEANDGGGGGNGGKGGKRGDGENGEWEDTGKRRERKRVEGLRKAEEARRRKVVHREAGGTGEEEDLMTTMPGT
ncbi:hypothetical protein MKZ38_003485 [Zalerion maritima]|uniref:tRNA(Phe) 7-[(3-amino-3-carboxypropyl)-4-demethylwyosine(37)-N(4)]-methyltransferase n=1 Tax=Zalerion maritima TaxID=339359 RepID=A0AAD5RXS6_9PEZI|nr:hypothetical protein MKZ38_003485 [Zalerion maritima]